MTRTAPVECKNCGRLPSIEQDKEGYGTFWVICHNCYDCDWNEEDGYVGNEYGVWRSDRAGAIEAWNEDMTEEVEYA